jgi:hypothetical protein
VYALNSIQMRSAIQGDLFSALQVMHDRIAALDSPWAIQLEGSISGKDG